MSTVKTSAKPLYILVDTNVWVDSFLGFRRGHAAAMEFLSAATERDIQLLYPVASLQDIFAVLVMEMKRKAMESGEITEKVAWGIRESAWACIESVCQNAVSVGAQESDVWLASKLKSLNWDLEDNMVLAAAKRCAADYLVTSDAHLIQKANVTAYTPSDMAKVLLAMG